MSLYIFPIVLACAAATAVVVVAIRWERPRRGPGGPRIANLKPRSGWDEDSAAAFSLSHREPDQPFTIEQAHHAMQSHRQCRANTCPRKQAAFRTLVAAGRVVPDLRADGYAQ
ncbi:hypothetical protein AB0H00_31185 [Nocardia sp. NPDC023852]|uniref:hypothetical protein n=1 Tax=Nocardia sp. NPDC023852 TaxID=3154697 RepID=UPI0033EE54CC